MHEGITVGIRDIEQALEEAIAGKEDAARVASSGALLGLAKRDK